MKTKKELKNKAESEAVLKESSLESVTGGSGEAAKENGYPSPKLDAELTSSHNNGVILVTSTNKAERRPG